MSLIGEGMELLGLFDKAKNADLYKQLGDWIDKVRNLQIENDRLHGDLKEAKEQLRFKGVVGRINGHTFVEGDDEEICPRCAEIDLRPVHLMSLRGKNGQFTSCPQCHLETRFRHPKRRQEALSTPPTLQIS